MHVFQRPESHIIFFTYGSYTRFKDWQFIYRARLGLVKLNGYNRSTRSRWRCQRHVPEMRSTC